MATCEYWVLYCDNLNPLWKFEKGRWKVGSPETSRGMSDRETECANKSGHSHIGIPKRGFFSNLSNPKPRVTLRRPVNNSGSVFRVKCKSPAEQMPSFNPLHFTRS